MKIITVDKSTKNPLELMQAKGDLLSAPEEVENTAKEGKLWYLIGWRDPHQFGFYHKKKAVAIDRSKVEKIAVSYMTRAKGQGWVALEVKYKEQGGLVPILESKVFKQEALDWFNDKMDVLQEVIGLEIEMHNYGPDC